MNYQEVNIAGFAAYLACSVRDLNKSENQLQFQLQPCDKET